MRGRHAGAGVAFAAGARHPVRARRERLLEQATVDGPYWLTLNLAADGPVAIVVDDLRWRDRPGMRFIALLLNRLEGNPVLVGSTRRTAAPRPAAGAGGALPAVPRLGRAAPPRQQRADGGGSCTCASTR